MQTTSVKAHSSNHHAGAVALVLAAALAAGLLAACGGGGGAQGEGDSPPAATPPKRIVFQRSAPVLGGGLQTDLYAVNEDGSGEVALAASQDDESLTTVWAGPFERIGDRVLYSRAKPGGNADIYSVKLDGTGTVTLAASPKNHVVVAIAGDRVIISVDGGGVLVVNAQNGSTVTLPADAEFVALQQGRVFYNSALAAGSARLYSVLPDGGATVELMASRGNGLLAVGPPSRLQLVAMTVADRLLLSSPTKALYVTNADATSLVLLAAVGPGQGLVSLTALGMRYWSLPVGDRVAYLGKDGALFSVKSDGSATLPLAAAPGGGGLLIVGSIAGNVLYQTLGTTGSPSGLYAIDVNGGSPRMLGAENTTAADVVLRDRILVVSYSNVFDLSAMRVDGSARVTLATGVDKVSGSSPDVSLFYAPLATIGKRIIFSRLNGAVRNTYAINDDGTGLTTLVGGNDTSDPEALGSDRLVFRRELNNKSDLYSVLSDGSGLVTLANSNDDERFGLFAGSKVVYTRRAADGHRDLFIVNGDGSGTRVLSSNADDKEPVAVF